MKTARTRVLEELAPSFQVEAHGIEDTQIEMTWEPISFSEGTLQLQLTFADPDLVSLSLPRDRLRITFLGRDMFVNPLSGASVSFGLILEDEIINQLSDSALTDI